jgi:hypothetical protein
MDFDPATGDALLFGGLDSNFSPTGASWAWNGSDWRQLTPASAPDARSLAAEVFDPATASLVLFGGESSAGTELSDTWNFGVAGTPVWQGAYTGGPDDLGPAMAHDDATGQTVLFGGLNTSADNMDSWTWVWDGTAWNQVADADQAGCRNTCLNAPPARTGATMAFDATTGQLLLFGGYSETAGQAYQMYTDTWSWDGTTWSQLASSQGGLSWSGSMVYDGATGQMLMIQTDGATTTTYEWSGSSWTLLRPAHQPAPVGNSAIAYDPANGTVALFGGIDNGGLDFDNSTWIWNGTDWAQVGDSPTGCSAECESSPPGVEGAQMAFDPATDRLVLAGGEDLDGPLADVWAWDGSSWTDAGAAPHAPTSELAYDPAHGTILEHDDASTWTYQVATPPGAPAISSATPGAEQVTLDWTAPASDGGSPVTGYDVYVGTSSGGESGQPVNPSLLAADTSSYTVTGLSDSTTYFFTVKAVNAAGTGSPSDEMSASTPGRPTMPQSVTATGGSGQLTAHWAAPSDTGGSPITDYLVTVTADEIGGSSTVHDVDSASATSYTVTGLTPGTVYGVKVSAVNAVGAGPDSLGYGVVVYGPPGPATAITATPGDASVVLRWTPPPTDDGSPILGWEIYEGTSPGSISSAPVNRAPLPGSATSYTVGSLQNGRSYYFIVRSYNLGGPSPAPGLVSATPNATGYLVVTANGVVASHGAVAYGSPAGLHLASPIVGAASAGGAGGYFLAGADGGVFNYGPGARFHGSAGNLRLVAPIVGMAVDPATGGYWLVASDGGIFNYGAPFYGSMGGTRLTAPIVGMTPAPDGRGYWLVAADGGVFALGPGAHFRGSAAAYHPAAPVTAMAGDPMTGGYWVAASDGHVYAFGAPSGGSLGGRSGSSALSGIAFNPSTAGYWLVDAAGRTYSGTTPVSANPVGGRAVAILPG